MIFNNTRQNNSSSFIHKFILSMIILSISIDIIGGVLLSIGFAHTYLNTNNNLLVSSFNLALSLVSIYACYMYYVNYKEDDMFIIAQTYIIVLIEYIYTSFFININNNKGGISVFVFLLYAYRVLIIALTIYKNNVIYEFLCNNKTLSTIGTVFVCLSAILLEKYGLLKMILDDNIAIILTILLIVLNFYIIFKLAQRSIKNNQVTYIIFVVSINLLLLRKIFQLYYYFKYKAIAFEINQVILFFSFIVLILGLFLELILRIKESDDLKNDFQMFYEIIEKNNNEMVIIYDCFYSVIYANKKVLEIMGKESTVEEQYRILEAISENDYYNEMKRFIRSVINKEGTFEGTIKLDSGVILNSYFQMKNISGKKIIVCTFMDVTEEYNINEKLRVSESKLKGVTENIMDIIATVDKDGIVTYANRAVAASLKMRKNDILGRDFREFMEKSFPEIEQFIQSKKIQSAVLSHKLVNPNKKVQIQVESVARKLFDEHGELEEYVVVCRNLEIKKQLDNLTEKYNEIKEYDQIRTEFFANLSHELRTPINIINSCLQLLNKEQLNGPEALNDYYVKYEKTIRQNCFRILRLINNIIDISRYDTGFFKLKVEPTDIINLVETVSMSTLPYVEGKGLSLMFDTDIEEKIIKCDVSQIERVILNLISNAVKFTEKGGNILVDVSTTKEFVNIRVKDSGIGIPKEYQETIFERFVQSDKSFKRTNEGSGIGLALVKSIIDLHKGRVFVEESSDKGSTFLVQLPNNVSDEEAAEMLIRSYDNNTVNETIGIEFSDIYE